MAEEEEEELLFIDCSLTPSNSICREALELN